ncbi:MAG: ATP-binding protein [Chloroflexota bacterium]
MAIYEFEGLPQFRNRAAELGAIGSWFESHERRALAIYGRRRVGKSWLFRAFAHGHDADIFVATTRDLADQLASFATVLERDGERPQIADVESFFRLLYRRSRDERRLVVIDELPNLIRVDRSLPSVLLKVMEEEAASSGLKLVVTGSHVGMMERLFAEREPLHDRVQPLRVRPLDFWEARLVLGDGPADRLLTAFGVAGGMPRYLTELAGAANPVARLARLSLDPLGALFDEPRAILGQELEAPAVYFSLLSALASGPAGYGDIQRRSHVGYDKIGRYLATLEALGLVTPLFPVTDTQRVSHARLYTLSDGFLRFWFRYVFPFQADLEAGLDARVVIDDVILPTLASHLAPTMEDIARSWVRRARLGNATRVGAWWGPALNAFRQSGERSTEEIDIVGLRGKQVTLVGEVRWRSDRMDVSVLGDLGRYKIPALAQQPGIRVGNPVIVLVSRSGFTPGLQAAADQDDHIVLVDADMLSRLPPAEANDP